MDMKEKTMFDINIYIDTLIEQMGMQNESPEEVARLKKGMLNQAYFIIMNAVSLYLQPDIIDFVMEKYKDEKDPLYVVTKLIRYSPDVQIKIIEALNDFAERTLAVHNRLNGRQ